MHGNEPRGRQFGFHLRACEPDGVIARGCCLLSLRRSQIIDTHLTHQGRREKVSILTGAARAAHVRLAEAENVFINVVACCVRLLCVGADVNEAERDLGPRHDIAAILRAYERIGVSDQRLGTIRRLTKGQRNLADRY